MELVFRFIYAASMRGAWSHCTTLLGRMQQRLLEVDVVINSRLLSSPWTRAVGHLYVARPHIFRRRFS